MRSLVIALFLVAAFAVAVHGHPKGGPMPFPQETKDNITSLSNAVTNSTLKSELNNAVSDNNRSSVMMLLTQVAAGLAGGAEADWEKAKYTMIGIADQGANAFMEHIAYGDHDHGPPQGPPNPVDMMANLPQMIPIRIASAKLKADVKDELVTEEQKKTADQLKTAYETWRTTSEAAHTAALISGQRPNMAEQVGRDTALSQAVRTAADALKNSNPSWPKLYDAIVESRAISIDRMVAKMEWLQTNLTSTGIKDLVDLAAEMKTLEADFVNEKGMSSAMATRAVELMNKITTAVDANIGTVTDRKMQKNLQVYKNVTGFMANFLSAVAPHADNLKAALNGQ